ncbi:GNAT family N-acetyltransferase [Candidatus Bipolaricaulota bacterium]
MVQVLHYSRGFLAVLGKFEYCDARPDPEYPDHRRRGLGKAVVLHAMHHMKAASMTHATVANAGTNEASRARYKAYGLTPWHLIDDYVKSVPLDG